VNNGPGHKTTRPTTNLRPALLLELDVVLEVVHGFHGLGLGADYDILVAGQTGAGRNQVTADDVLLQAFQIVYAGTDGSL